MGMGPPVVAYCRISKDRIGAGLGVDRQRYEIEQLAERHGATVERWYVDNDMSAFNRRKIRKEYRQLLEDITVGNVATVLVWHTDRLHRQNRELEEWIDVAGPRGVQVHTVTAGELDLNTPNGRMIARVLASIAGNESEHKGERLRSKMAELRRSGLPHGGPRPFGFKQGGMELEPIEAALVRSGTQAVLRGATLSSVAREWNNAGVVRPQSNKPFTAGRVRQLLMRPRNAALVSYNGEVVGPAQWPAIVGEDELRAICQILTTPGRQAHAGNQAKWLGSSIYRCGLPGCGHPLVIGRTRNGRSGGYKPAYICQQGRRGASTRAPGRHVSRLAEDLDQYVGEAVMMRLTHPDVRHALRPHEAPVVDVAALQDELAVIEADQQALSDDLVHRRITREMMVQINAGLMARAAEIEATLASLVSTTPAGKMANEPDIPKAWASAPLDVKREVLRELLDVVVQPAPPGKGRFLAEYVDIQPRQRV